MIPAPNQMCRSVAEPVRRRMCGIFGLGFCLVLVTSGILFGGQLRRDPDDAIVGISVRSTTMILGPEGKPFNMPSDAAVGLKGSLYVLDGVNNRVVVYDAQGKFRFTFGSGGIAAGDFNFPLGITAGPDGKIYVADSGNHRFQIFSAAGKPLEAVQLPAAGLAVPSDPTDVAIDSTRQRLYIADNDNHQLNVYNLATDRFEQALGGPGLGQRQFRFPFLIDVSAQGYIFVVEPINTRVQVLNPSGKFVSFLGDWGVKPGQLFRPKGVATFENLVFVSDSYLGHVQIFDMHGVFLGMLVDSAGVPLKFTTPMGMAVDAVNHRLYVVELKTNRVCRMDLE